MTFPFKVLAATVIAAAVVSASPEQSANAVALFQRGLLLERAEGNVAQAIVLFERVIAEYPNDKAVVPQTLSHLALVYERRADPRASLLWKRLLDDFGSSPYAEEAREKVRQDAGPFARRVIAGDLRWMAVSPDGRFVAHVPTEEGGGRLLVRDIDSGKDIQAFRDASRDLEDPQAVWSPDGRRLAFVTRDRSVAPNPAGRSHDVRLWTMNGGQTKTVAEAPVGQSTIAWSPDSQWLAVQVGLNAATPTGGIRIVNVASAITRELFGPTRQPANLTWSPNSHELAFRTTDDQNRDTFWIGTVDTGQRRPLAMPLSPSDGRVNLAMGLGAGGAWKTNGSILVRQAATGGTGSSFFLVPSGGGPAVKVCSSQPKQNQCESMSPNGATQIVSNLASSRLSVLDVARGSERRLTSGFADEFQPSMSPDGRLVLFVSNLDGAWGLYAIPVDQSGANPVRIAVLDSRPSSVTAYWGSNGRLITRTFSDGNIVARVNVDANGRAAGPVGRLTHETFGSFGPAISPRGDQIAYWYDKGIAVMTADGAGERPVQSSPNTGHLQWRSDNEILFRRAAPAGAPSAIVSLNVLTGAVQSLVELPPGPGFFWQYVPSRREVVYVTNAPDGPGHTIRARSIADGSDRVISTIQDMLTFRYTFRVSPDGQRIAYGKVAGTGANLYPELHVMTIDGREDRVVPTSTVGTGNWRPSGYPYDWSPNGRFLLYDRFPGQLTAVDITSGESWPIAGITDTDRGEWAGMQWSPDGSFILASGGGSVPQIRLAEGVTYDAVVKLAKQSAR